MTHRAVTDSAPARRLERFLESERDTWLRRRFTVFCILMVLLTAADLAIDRSAVRQMILEEGRQRWTSTIQVMDSLLAALAPVAALIYVRRRNPGRARLLTLALWVTGGVGAAGVVMLRVRFELETYPLDEGLAIGSYRAWTIMAPAVILLSYTLACLLIPWTFREALRPAAVLMTAVAGVALFDRIRIANWVWPVAIGAAAVAMVPGLVICWWRYSRFRRRMQLRFESLSYRRLQADLAGARRIHEACLPSLTGGGPVGMAYAYEPMSEIGGDLVFVHSSPDGRQLTMVLFDVTGHGIAAALTVNRLYGELERIFAEHPHADPAETLCSLNRYIHLTLATHSVYVTAICIRLDVAGGVLQWANGGHPSAVLLRADGAISLLESNETILGVLGGSDFQPSTVEAPFAAGDVIIAYTDGASESTDQRGAHLGCDGVRQLIREMAASRLPPQEWPAALLERIAGHRNGPPDDDTLIAALWIGAAPHARASPDPPAASAAELVTPRA